jgi:isopenicillin N synthase-like dioxygenase
MSSIPLVDLRGNLDPTNPAAHDSAQLLYEALSTIGFAYITGHRVSTRSRDAAFAASREFHASSFEQKQSLSVRADADLTQAPTLD